MHGQKGELGQQLPELALLTVPYVREYFYTKIRFSTPESAPSCKSADTSVDHAGNHARTHARKTAAAAVAYTPVHAYRSMHAGLCMQHRQHAGGIHAGSCMPVHACRSMHVGSCQLLLMRACARRAYPNTVKNAGSI
jgi:hypothetical protein